MNYGLFYQLPVNDGQTYAERYQDTIDQIVLGDALGYNTAWLAEYHFEGRFSSSPNPLLLLSALSQKTKNIRLGTAGIILPLHHPVRLAEEVAMVDVLSGGRLELGVGRGSASFHYEGLEIPFQKRNQRFQEGLEILHLAFSEDEFDFKGSDFHLQGIRIFPQPVQQPIPISVLANSPDTLLFALKNNYSVIINSVVNSFGRTFFDMTQLFTNHSNDQSKLSAVIPVFISDNDEKAWNIVEESFCKYLGIVKGQYSPNIIREQYGIIGSIEYCRKKILDLENKSKLSEIICWFNPGGLIPHDKVKTSMELFKKEIMSAVSIVL